jgi:hypothetical protein
LSCELGLAPIAIENSRSENMQRIILTAAAVLLGAGLAATAAMADMNYGPMTNNGLCFTRTPGWGDMGFGYWSECPKPAAATTTTTTAPRHHVKHS